MRHLIQTTKRQRPGRIGASIVGALAIAALVAGCDTTRLLTVQAPNSVPATVFDDPANATLMVNSVIGDFECAFGGFVGWSIHGVQLYEGRYSTSKKHSHLECAGRVPTVGTATARWIAATNILRNEIPIQSAVAAALCRRTPNGICFLRLPSHELLAS